jgi:hypothetical protein
VHSFVNFIYVSLPRRWSSFTGCFSRGRRTPSSQGNGSYRGFFSLPPFASAFRSSRPTGPLLLRTSIALVNSPLLLSPHSPAEHSYSHNQSQSQTGRRNEYNDPLNDPSSAWSNYGANMSTSSMPIVVSGSLPSPVGQQSAFPGGDDPRLQYSYLVPQQASQPYQSYRDPSTSYSNNPTTSPRTEAPGNHVRDERWQLDPYGGTPPTKRAPERVFSPVASYPGPSFQYPAQNPPQGMLPDPRYSVPINTSASPSTGGLRRGPVSVERTTTRSSAHATTSPYPRHPHISDISSDHPPPKKRRKRANAEQLRVLNEVYARNASPSIEERKELAAKLDMAHRSVQTWYASYFYVSDRTFHISARFQNKRLSMRNTHHLLTAVQGPGLGMTDNGDSIHISETPKAMTQGKKADDLDDSVRTASEDLERCVDYNKGRATS